MNQISSKQKLARKQASEWIIRLNSDNPNQAESLEKAFLTWLNSNPENQIAYLRAEWLWSNSERLNLQEAPDTHILGSLLAFPNQFRQRLIQHKAVAATCACLLLVMTIGLGILQPFSSATQNDVLFTSHGQIKTHRLLDGSSVTLNANSKIQVAINSNRREISLIEGEAFFDVKRLKKIPFLVKGPGINVRVLGTQFSVKNSIETASVTVLEGKVSVSTNLSTQASNKEALILTKDEAALLNKATDNIEPIKVNAKEKLSWTAKKLIYKGESLEKVISDINQHYDTKLQLSDSEIGKTTVIAVISIDNQEKTLQKLESLFNLISIHDKGSDIILLKKSQ